MLSAPPRRFCGSSRPPPSRPYSSFPIETRHVANSIHPQTPIRTSTLTIPSNPQAICGSEIAFSIIMDSLANALEYSLKVINYINAVRDFEEDRAKVIDALQATNYVLKQLEVKGEALQWQGMLKGFLGDNGHLEKLNKMLAALESRVCYSRTILGVKMKTKFIWPFTQDDVRKIQLNIEALKTALALELQEANLYSLFKG